MLAEWVEVPNRDLTVFSLCRRCDIAYYADDSIEPSERVNVRRCDGGGRVHIERVSVGDAPQRHARGTLSLMLGGRVTFCGIEIEDANDARTVTVDEFALRALVAAARQAHAHLVREQGAGTLAVNLETALADFGGVL